MSKTSLSRELNAKEIVSIIGKMPIMDREDLFAMRDVFYKALYKYESLSMAMEFVYCMGLIDGKREERSRRRRRKND